jgi:DNA-binding NarL/FixJ family response regulator
LKSSVENCEIFVFGPLFAVNEMLAGWIAEKTGFNCQCVQDTNVAKAINQQEKGKLLILWDCMGKGVTSIWTDLGTKFGGNNLNCMIALYNVSPQIDIQIEMQALKRGVNGLFLSSCNSSDLVKGIKAILNGELWFSRRSLTAVLSDLQNSNKEPPSLEKPLTPREKEILLCILTGASNRQLSSDLNISFLTVKSHLYNIYKKINVPNRLQATLWAIKNL